MKGYHSAGVSVTSEDERGDDFMIYCADLLMKHLHSCIHEFNTTFSRLSGLNYVGGYTRMNIIYYIT